MYELKCERGREQTCLVIC